LASEEMSTNVGQKGGVSLDEET